MKNDDIASGLAFCRAAGWNQLARDWEMLLHLSPHDCRVAINNDDVIGTVTTIRYQNFFSWMGMVLVDPLHRGRGIGMQLLHEALEVLQNEETVKLDATPAGREIYLKLNFVDEYRLSRMSTIASVKKPRSSTARAIQKSDLESLTNFDREIFGADRRQILEWMLERVPGYAYLVEEEKIILGYCLARNGHHFIHIGPVFSENFNVAKDLVSNILFNCAGQPVILDAMQFNPEWMEWLGSIGFIEQRPFIRMFCGKNSFPGLPEKQFAILGPEFG